MGKFNSIAISLIIFIVLTMISCKNSQTTGEAENIKEGSFPFSSPGEIFELVQKTGVVFENKVLNPVENVERYYTDKNKALNIGVYLSDLTYATTFNNDMVIKNYLGPVQSLNEDLELEITYDAPGTADNRKKYLSHLSDNISKTYALLYTRDPELASLFLMGIWVEELYICTNISNDVINNQELVSIIMSEYDRLQLVLAVLDNLAEKSSLTSGISGALSKLGELYSGISEKSITQENIDQIKGTIASIRESIIY